MGYNMSQLEASFKIKSENFANVIKVVKEELIDKDLNLRWIDEGGVEQACEHQDIDEMFHELGFNTDVDNVVGGTGDIIGIWANGEKLGDEETILEVIAPYVESGSFIEMQGEDGCRWKWSFKDGKMKELAGKISYDE